MFTAVELFNSTIENGKVVTVGRYAALSSDELPTEGIGNGSEVRFIDTGDVVYFDGSIGEWYDGTKEVVTFGPDTLTFTELDEGVYDTFWPDDWVLPTIETYPAAVRVSIDGEVMLLPPAGDPYDEGTYGGDAYGILVTLGAGIMMQEGGDHLVGVSFVTVDVPADSGGK